MNDTPQRPEAPAYKDEVPACPQHEMRNPSHLPRGALHGVAEPRKTLISDVDRSC